MTGAAAKLARTAGLSSVEAEAVCRGDRPEAANTAKALALGMFDPVGIQQLVMLPRRPIGVLGASLLLAAWDADANNRAATHDVQVLYAGGGQAIVVGHADAVRAWADAQPIAFNERLGGRGAAEVLQCTVGELALGRRGFDGVASGAVLAALGVDPSPTGFGSLLGALSVLVTEAKNRAAYGVDDHDESRCTASGVLPASRGEPSALFHQYAETGRTDTKRSRWTGGRSFADLTGGVAYVAIDGTGIGSQLQRLRSISDYAAFSDALHAAFGRAALQQHMEALHVDPNDWIPILAGGDDLLLAIAAGVRFDGGVGPLELVHALLERIGHAYDESVRHAAEAHPNTLPTVGAAAGLVVGDGVTARIGTDLAQALMKGAKRLQRGALDEEERAERRFVVDFEYLQKGSDSSVSVEALRARRLRPFTPPNRRDTALLRLGRRPFTLAESKALASQAAAVSTTGEGRRLLYQLRAALEEPMSGLVTGTYLIARHDALAGAAPPVGASLDRVDTLLIRDDGVDPRGEHLYSSAIPDLVEMATFRTRAARTEG